MKVVAINGSPREKGNTYHSLRVIGEQLNLHGIELEIIHVGNQTIRGCGSCGGCAKNRDEKCVITNDIVNESIQKMKDADGIILGSPVHFAGVGGTMKAFLDRTFYVSGQNGGLFAHKVGATIVSVRRSGGIATFDELNHYLLYSQMAMPTSNYWNIVHGTAEGDVLKDVEGIQTMNILAKNMVWLLKLIDNGKGVIETPEQEKKQWMSFIR